jgi:hypothetical protein
LFPHEVVPVWGFQQGDPNKTPEPLVDDAEGKEGTFPKTMGCLMIFGRMVSYDSKRRQELMRREVYVAKLVTPAFL